MSDLWQSFWGFTLFWWIFDLAIFIGSLMPPVYHSWSEIITFGTLLFASQPAFILVVFGWYKIRGIE